MKRKKIDTINIWIMRQNETINYAAEELCKYLRIMAGSNDAAFINKKFTIDADGLKLGLFTDYGIKFEAVEDPEKDDAIHINVKNSKGIITGSNPRSVLFAIYKFLEANGCRWLRPGKDGEIVPSQDVYDLNTNIFEKAFSRFRGNNNCGACSIEHYLEKIEWMPKVGLNTFFRELFFLKPMYNQWYRREYHSLKKPEQRSDIEYMAYDQQVSNAIKKRGLIYQGVGHGWPSVFFGLSETQMEDKDSFDKLVENETQYIALLNGKREASSFGPRFTELCYGNPEVRKRMVQCVAEYAGVHTEIDMLHFWQSDFMNTRCECEMCRNTRPSDFYVMMLNGIDEELSKRGLKTQIVFLVYKDLLWAPEKESIKNPERFFLMFAPIDRNYSEHYDYTGDESLLPGFEYNKNLPDLKMGGFIASLKKWQEKFTGLAFLFDYHMTWYHYLDQGYYAVARIMAEDIRRLPGLGFSGLVNCQVIRTSFPTGFPQHVHAKFLWNPEEDFDILASAYFKASFGNDGGLCLDYMKQLSDLFCPNYFYKFKPATDRDDMLVLNKLSSIPTVIEEFRHIIERNMYSGESACSKSWEYIFIHAELALMLSHALRLKLKECQKVADAYWTKVIQYIMINESRLESVFDPLWFNMYYIGVDTLSPNLLNVLAE